MTTEEMREFGLWYVGIVMVVSITIMFAYDYFRTKRELRKSNKKNPVNNRHL